MNYPHIKIIVATQPNLGIGKNNQLLKSIPSDLQRFKDLTTNHVVIMGRLTWESLPKKPLRNRINIVVTSKYKELSLEYADELDTYFVSDEVRALKLAISLEKYKDNGKVFIIGGGSLYQSLLPYCHAVVKTTFTKNYEEEPDVFFPDLQKLSDWEFSTRALANLPDEDEYYLDIHNNLDPVLINL